MMFLPVVSISSNVANHYMMPTLNAQIPSVDTLLLVAMVDLMMAVLVLILTSVMQPCLDANVVILKKTSTQSILVTLMLIVSMKIVLSTVLVMTDILAMVSNVPISTNVLTAVITVIPTPLALTPTPLGLV